MWSLERSHLRVVGAGRRAAAYGALAVALYAGSAAAADNAAPTLKIAGKATFVTETRATSEGFEVRATLGDEIGRPIASGEVRIRAHATDANATLHRCGDPRGEAGGELLLTTDKSGRVCITVTGMPSGTVELSFADARGYLEPASRVVNLPESVASSFELGFDPPVTTLSLDRPVQELGLVARAHGEAALPEASELVLSMAADGAERELGRVALDGLGEVQRLAVVSASFGQPGPARLLGRLRARSGQDLAETSVPIVRLATVALHTDASLGAGVEPGQVIQVQAASALGPVTSGVIEARSRGMSLAAAPVRNGVASLSLPEAPATLLGGSVTFAYVGEGAGWLSGPPLELRVLAAGPSFGRYALWILAAALAALAAVLSWRRPPRPRPSAATPPARVRASVEVLEAFPSGGGYRGFVRDAHDGAAVVPAALSLIGPGPNRPVLVQVRTGRDGSFQIEGSGFPIGTLVEVTAPFHATLTAPLPVPGVIELSVISRRRALLDRLVRWAERHGKPWTRAGSDPTPGHVASVATNEAEAQVEHWARGLEQLAFGATPPDAATEQAAGVADDPKTTRERGID